MPRVNTVPALIPPGAVIGRRYRIDGLLAEGGMGIVYKGFHLALQQPIAIKVVRAEFADRPEAIARFLNEARALAGLRGPHIAQVLDVGRMGNGPPYMVLEYLEGADLRTVLESEGPLSLTRAITYVLEACEALAEAHARGVIHRDIKPENLFLTGPRDGTETLKLIDFGVSKRVDPQARCYTEDGQGLGSPHYMSPEQMTRPHEVDARADIWSLGVVLFELLSGAVPFDGDTLPEACANILSAEPHSLTRLRPNVAPEIERVVLRCLAKAPADRYADIAELAESLVPFAGPEGFDSLRRVRRSLGQHRSSTPALVAMLPAVEAEAGKNHAINLDLTPGPRVLSKTNPNVRTSKRSRWRAPLVVASGALAISFAAAHWTRVLEVADRTRGEVAGLTSDALEGLAPVAERAMLAARSAGHEVAVRFTSSKNLDEPTNSASPAPAPGYSLPNPSAPSRADDAAAPTRLLVRAPGTVQGVVKAQQDVVAQ